MFGKIGTVGLSAFVLWACSGPGICCAQTSKSATALVTVTVVPGMSVINEKSLSFGQLAEGSGLHMIASDAPAVGSFTVSGLPGASVSLTFPRKVTLQSPDGHLLAFAPTIPVCKVAGSHSAYQRSFPAVTGGSANLGPDGILHVRFGGSVNTDHAESGSYSGQYTITIIY